MISFAFNLSFALTQFHDNKRSDFWQMFVHHIITLLMFTIGWCCNFFRICSLGLLSHDLTDAVMEFSRIFRYSQFHRTSKLLFFIFVIVWATMRLIFFWRILYSVYFEAKMNHPMMLIFKSLLFILQCLNVYWSYLIFEVLARNFKSCDFDAKKEA